MPRAGLDQDLIVATALDLVDEVGLDGLSTRALADRLGVRSPALYWHFRAKDDLVTAMAEAMMRQTPDAAASLAALGPRPSAIAVERWLVSRGEQFRQVLLSRRDGARVHAGTRPSAAQYGGIEAQLEVLGRLGLDATAASRVTVAISRFVVGWVLEEQADHLDHGDPTGTRPRPDEEAYPLVAAAFAAFERDDPHVTFSACLTGIVHGLVHGRGGDATRGSSRRRP